MTNPLRDIILDVSQRGFLFMKVSSFQTYRSEGRGVNHTDDRVRVTIDCSVKEFNQHFRNDPDLKKIEMNSTAIEACKEFDKFHFQVFSSGRPLMIEGKPINHTTLNKAYDLAYKVLLQIKE